MEREEINHVVLDWNAQPADGGESTAQPSVAPLSVTLPPPDEPDEDSADGESLQQRERREL